MARFIDHRTDEQRAASINLRDTMLAAIMAKFPALTHRPGMPKAGMYARITTQLVSDTSRLYCACVHGAYDISNAMREAGFRFDSGSAAWCATAPTLDELARYVERIPTGVEIGHSITVDDLSDRKIYHD